MGEIISKNCLDRVVRLRKNLHRYPELSGHESQTADRLEAFLSKQKPDSIIKGIGGHGLAAVYNSGKSGPTLMLRADLDALPVEEVNRFAHRSRHPGVAHTCGHDGHMAILSGLATIVRTRRPQKGRLVLLFQPEEETGQGAASVIADKAFREIEPDWVFALHNLPGYPAKSAVLREGVFASASKGMIVQLQGRSAHAAHPEQGNSPVHMMVELMKELTELPGDASGLSDFALLTIIHAKLGEVAFGTTPGKAVVMATLRTFLNSDMELLSNRAMEIVNKLAQKHGIKAQINHTEEFPATHNDAEANRLVEEAVRRSGVTPMRVGEAFRWSEDFGHFTGKYRGALFGLGSGEKHPSLHNHDYDFPDHIIPAGIMLFYHIADQLLTIGQDV